MQEERFAQGAAFGLEVRGNNFTASSEAILERSDPQVKRTSIQ